MTGIGIEIVILFVLALLNGVFAMTEFAIISARKTRLQHLAERGDRRAATALEVAKSPDTLLSTTQIAVTLFGVSSGAYGGVTLSRDFGALLNRLQLIAPHGELIAFGIVVIGTTLVSIVIGELIPKRLALAYPETLAVFLVRPINKLSWLLRPAVAVLNALTHLAMKLFPPPAVAQQNITEEELQIILEQGAEAGVLEEAEQELAQRAIRLGDRSASSLMTPRTEVVWLDIDDDRESVLERVRESTSVHYPVCRGSLDEVLGIVSLKDLFDLYARNPRAQLTEALHRDVLHLPAAIDVLRLLERFRESGQRLALLVDEFGGVDGLVSRADIVDAILGDLVLPAGTQEPLVTTRSDGSYLIDASLPLAELTQLLEPSEPFDAETFQTLGGLVLAQLGHIPKSADLFALGGYRFEVVDMDGNRVDKVLVTKLAPPAAGDEEQ